MGNTGTGIGQPSALKLPGSAVVASSLNAARRALVPRGISLGIGGPQLLFGVKAIGELVEFQVGLYRGHAADQDDQNPFHRSTRLSPRNGRTGNGLDKPPVPSADAIQRSKKPAPDR